MLQVHLANFITHIQQLLNKSSKYSDLWEENLHTPDSLIASAMRHGIAQLLNTAVASLGRDQTRSSGERDPRQKVGRVAVGRGEGLPSASIRSPPSAQAAAADVGRGIPVSHSALLPRPRVRPPRRASATTAPAAPAGPSPAAT